MKRLSVTAPNERRRKRRRDRVAGTWEGETKRGWTESEQGEGASEPGKVDQKESEKLRESVEKRRAKKPKAENQPRSIPLNGSDPGWERRLNLSRRKKT